MTLSSMVVSRDWPEVSVLECILGSLHIGVEIESEPERAWAKLRRSKIDALIVDRDLKGADSFLRHVRENRTQAQPIPLVILSGSRSQLKKDNGAVFSFEKPISVEQAVRTLSAARNLILDGRLRYHRQALSIPISLTYGSRKPLPAVLINLSQGGMGIHLDEPLHIRGPVHIAFKLPGSKRAMKAEGEISWTDQCGNAGIHFIGMADTLKRGLQLWLERQYFLQ